VKIFVDLGGVVAIRSKDIGEVGFFFILLFIIIKNFYFFHHYKIKTIVSLTIILFLKSVECPLKLLIKIHT
jgi:hypothetical protein